MTTKKDDDIIDQATKAFAGGDVETRNMIIGAAQKAGRKWLPDDAFKKHFETGKSIANDRGDDEMSMQFWIFGSPMEGYKEGEESLTPCILPDWEPNDDAEKQKLMMGLGAKIADEWGEDVMLTTIVHISEAWMVKRDKDSNTKGVVPSEEPDRIEVVLVHAMSMDQRVSYWHAEIQKDENDKFTGLKELMSDEYDPEKPRTASQSMIDYLSLGIMKGYALAKNLPKKEEKSDDKTK